MVSGAMKDGLRHKPRHNNEPSASTVYWQLLYTYDAIRSECDRDDAKRAWLRLSKLNLDSQNTAKLINAISVYVFCHQQRKLQSRAKVGETEKACRTTVRDIAKSARRLAKNLTSICNSWEAYRKGTDKDPGAYPLVADVFCDPRYRGLRSTLAAFATDLEKCAECAKPAAARRAPPRPGKKPTQVAIALAYRQEALRCMVDLTRGSSVPWTALAILVNLIGQSERADEELNVIGKDLELEYSRLPSPDPHS